ncbi:MAG: MobF family relaxase, partial [Limisphaerales bacterium]
MRSRIESCVRQAVAAGVGYLEERAGVTRRGADGQLHQSARLIFAGFQHSTSRSQDPQLHIHTILQNIAVRADGTTGTVEPREIYRHQMAAGTLFRAELAAQLERDLGLRARREGRAFELLGVDRALMAAFSQRRAQVLEALQGKGLSGGKAAEIAALTTRPKKSVVTRDELWARWQETGRAYRWSHRDLASLRHTNYPARDPQQETRETAQAAIATLTRSHSHFSPRQLTQALAEEAQGRSLGAREVKEIGQALLRSPQLICLGTYKGEVQWTTKEVLALEKQLLDHCQTLREREVLSPAAPALVAATLNAHPRLS